MNRIVFENENFVIADKDHGIPTVPLKNQHLSGTLLGFVCEFYPEVLNVTGKNPWEGGALHRLDTDTAGLVVFARNQDFFDRLNYYQINGNFIKTYIAKTDGNQIEKNTITSYFRSYGVGKREVRPTNSIDKSDNRTLYRTDVEDLGSGVFKCTIAKGFRHQIRAHLAFSGCPIKGDKLYNSIKTDDVMHLRCVAVKWPGFEYEIRPYMAL